MRQSPRKACIALSFLVISLMKIKSALSENSNKELGDLNRIAASQEYMPVEGVMKKSLSSLFQDGSMSKEIFREIMSEKNNLVQMASECYPGQTLQYLKRISIQGSFLKPIQISSRHYLIPLTCSWGRGSNGYVVFTYKSNSGLERKPLLLDIASIDKLGRVSIEKSGLISARYIDFDAQKKELLVRINCHYTDGQIASKSIYKFHDGSPILLEYWRDDLKNYKCLNSTNFQKAYP